MVSLKASVYALHTVVFRK